MASGNETSGNCGPTSGNCGPDFEWEYVPIPFEATDDKELHDKKEIEEKSEVKENLPSVEDMKLEDTDGEKPVTPEVKSKVRNFSRLNPSEEDMEAIPDDIEDLFAKHGDDLMIEEKSGERHIYFLFKETGGQKHYKCINSNCHSSLVVEYMDAPKEETTKRATNHP